MNKKHKEELECPSCGKKGFLKQIIQYRPSGMPRSVKYFCDYANRQNQRCGFGTLIRLNHGQHDYIGGVWTT